MRVNPPSPVLRGIDDNPASGITQLWIADGRRVWQHYSRTKQVATTIEVMPCLLGQSLQARFEISVVLARRRTIENSHFLSPIVSGRLAGVAQIDRSCALNFRLERQKIGVLW